MEFDKSMKRIGQLTNVDIPPPDDEGFYIWKHDRRYYKTFQRNRKWYWECSWGETMSDTIEHRNLLSQILQFNLKRMRFLDATLFLNPSDKQLYFRQTITPEDLNEKNLEERFNDFLLNVEVMEERFFPRLTEQRAA